MAGRAAPILACLLVALLLLLRFGDTLSQPLSYNDTGESVRLVERVLPRQHTWRDLWRWTRSPWGMFPPSHYYRPLAMASFVADWHLWKHNAFGYRLTNLILLIASALSLGALATRWMGRAGWLAALVWAGAPGSLEGYYLFSTPLPLFAIQDKAATWVIARPDLLAATFALLTFCCLTSKDRTVWLAGPLYFLALLSKESALPLAPVVFVYALLEKSGWSRKWRYLVPIACALAVYLVLRQAALGVSLMTQVINTPNNARTMVYWSGTYLLGPAIRLLGWLIEVLRSGWLLFSNQTPLAVIEGAIYLFSLFLLVRYKTRQLLFWTAWALCSVCSILPLPVFWCWGHYWFCASIPSAVVLCLALQALWQNVIRPRLAGGSAFRLFSASRPKEENPGAALDGPDCPNILAEQF